MVPFRDVSLESKPGWGCYSPYNCSFSHLERAIENTELTVFNIHVGKLRPEVTSAVHKVRNDLVTKPKARAIPPALYYMPLRGINPLPREQKEVLWKGREIQIGRTA